MLLGAGRGRNGEVSVVDDDLSSGGADEGSVSGSSCI